MARPNFPMMGMNLTGMTQNLPNMSNPQPMQINMMHTHLGGFPGMMPPPIGMPGSMMYNHLNQMTPLSNTPLATNTNIMGLLNRPNLPTSGEYRKVYVGKIPPGLSDAFILKLLEACGSVANWKRTTDHNGRPRNFGFCEYHTVESMLKCLRLLNHLKLEESYELSIKVDSKTEEFLKQWREQKKNEWIENLKRRGVDVNLDDIKKRENNGEPLEWELQLINKDSETRKTIFDIMTQKNEIEMYAKANERPEDFLKDIKELTNNPYSKLNQYQESERERERRKRKENNFKKLEKTFKEEEHKWEKHEEIREKERQRLKYYEEDLFKKKKRLLERDLNYDSTEEKKRIKANPKYYIEYKQMRIKEREFDEMMRRKENPRSDFYDQTPNNSHLNQHNCTVTDLALVEHFEVDKNKQEKIAKSEVVVIEYNDDEEENKNYSDHENENNNNHEHHDKSYDNQPKKKNEKLILNLNRNTKKGLLKNDDYEDENDPYHKKNVSHQIQIDEETEKMIMEISQEVNNERKEEERRLLQKQTLNNIIADPADSKQKMIELQKQVFEMIPKEKDSLFKYPINWNIVLSNDILDNKLKPWIVRKLKEKLGEDEPRLVIYILKELANKTSPFELYEKIKVIFDNETDEFMINMWKTFLFEVLKAEKLQSFS